MDKYEGPIKTTNPQAGPPVMEVDKDEPNVIIIEPVAQYQVTEAAVIQYPNRQTDQNPHMENQGVCRELHDKHERIPVISKTCAIILLIVNILLPGWGTVFLAAFSPHTGYFILIGLLQFLLAGFIIGWIWAIYTSMQVLYKSKHHSHTHH